METLLETVSQVEQELTLIDNLVRNICLFELPEGKLVMNLQFPRSEETDLSIIGGLVATIQEFAGAGEGNLYRSISLTKLNVLFVTKQQFLVVFVVDQNYQDEQFEKALYNFANSFDECIKHQDYGSTIDGAAIAVQTIYQLLSEDLNIDLQLGPIVTIYPFKLKELAEQTALQVLGAKKKTGTDLYDDTESQAAVQQEQQVAGGEETIDQLLSQFLATFADVNELSVVSIQDDGSFLHHVSTRLPEGTSKTVYEIVMSMIDTVSFLLDSSIEDRTMDLDDRALLFMRVNDVSFVYIVVDNLDSLEYIEPVLTRITSSLGEKIPDN